jgi:hypothetical protein
VQSVTNRFPGWALVAALVVVLCGELLSRFYLGLGHPPLSQAHPTIEYLFKPNQDVYRFGNHFKTNRYGMRSADFPPQKADPSELRVLVYGDSVINGGNLTDQSHLATTYLQQALAADLHRPVIVANISAGSWGPPNELAYMRQFGFLDADIVVLVLSSSDYDDAPTFEPLNPLTHPTEEPISALWEGVTRYLPRYIGAATVNEAGIVPDSRHVANRRDIEICLAAEKELLESAKSSGIRVLLLQHWTRAELHNRQPLPGHALIRQTAAEAGVPIIEDAEAMQARIKAGRNPFRDDIHPNEEGQRVLGELLLQALLGTSP